MRTEKEMFELILKTADQLPQVLAVGMNGSRTNRRAPKDKFQDYDIVYVTDDKEALLKDRSWLERFGPLLISQEPENMELFPPSLGERYSFLMLFEDGNRIDLMLCPLSEAAHWLAEDQLLEILWDPQHLLQAAAKPSDRTYWVQRPTARSFADGCNEFWWVATYVVKGIWRGELLYASDHLYDICQRELLRLLSYEAGLKTGFSCSVGKNFKYLFTILPNEQARFEALLDFSTLPKVTASLLATEAYFHEKAQELAAAFDYPYDQLSAAKVMAYTREQLS